MVVDKRLTFIKEQVFEKLVCRKDITKKSKKKGAFPMNTIFISRRISFISGERYNTAKYVNGTRLWLGYNYELIPPRNMQMQLAIC